MLVSTAGTFRGAFVVTGYQGAFGPYRLPVGSFRIIWIKEGYVQSCSRSDLG